MSTLCGHSSCLTYFFVIESHMNNLETGTFSYQKDFKTYLQRILDRRCRENPNYSLRSFARGLDMDASLLSKLISGKRKMTNKQIEKLGKKLNLTLREINSFKNTHIENATLEADRYQLSLDEFDVISDWQHYAILEMMVLDEFQTDLSWIARHLKMSTKEAQKHIDRLKKIGILKIDKENSWHDLSQGKSTHILDKNFTSYAHKQSQKNILKKAIESLDSTSIEKRDQSSMMVATSPERIAQAKDMITLFRRELTNFLEESEEKSAIYQMSVSLFPLIEIENTNNSNKDKK